MTKPNNPRRNIGAPLAHSEWARDAKDAFEGSYRLKWTIAHSIIAHAQRKRLTVANAINELLYAGELR